MYLMNHPSPLKRVHIATLACAACIASAVFLRVGKGNWLREGITDILGFEWRAVLEHLLAAIGVPVVTAVPCLGLTLGLSWAAHALCRRVGWTWEPLAKHPDKVASWKDLALLVGISTSLYILAGVFWEWRQAFVGVYGQGHRGYIQWSQLACDFSGALISFSIACWVSKRNPSLFSIHFTRHTPSLS